MSKSASIDGEKSDEEIMEELADRDDVVGEIFSHLVANSSNEESNS